MAAGAPPVCDTAAAFRAADRRILYSPLRGERETHMFCNGCNNNGLWVLILIIILFGCGNGCGCN